MPPPSGHNAVIGVRRPALIFCLPSVRPCGNHAKRKRCTNEKTIQCLNQTPRSMYPSIFNSFSVIRTASAKNRRFHVPQPTFLFPLETPIRLHAICCTDGKTIQCLSNPSQPVPIYTVFQKKVHP